MSALLAPAPPARDRAPSPATPRSEGTTRAAGTARRRRPVYLRPVPSTEGEVLVAAPMSPTPLVTVSPAPAEPAPKPRPRDPFDEDATPLRSLTGPAVDPGRVCMSILQVAAEAMRGLRPLVQLARWVDDGIFNDFAAFAPPHGSRTSVRQRLAPGSAATVLARGRFRRVRVVRISPHVAECTVLVDVGDRVRAVVVRLEERGPSWRATELAAV